MKAVPAETFGFAAKPKVVNPRSKYREPVQEDEDPERVQNLMFEKRVVRGNTYARIITSKDNEIKNATKSGKSFKKTIQIQKEQIDYQRDQYEPGTPKPVAGRQNIEVQTDEFVEQLTDKPPEYEKDTQTEVFIDRPNPRLFMPKKTGIDQETQIWDGDLFDFDYEVEPILQVLLGKTLEQSRMEVLEEEELRVMKEQQKRFEQLRNAELAEMQRLEAKEKRLYEESERRKLQYKKQKEQNVLSHKKLISRNIAKQYLSKLRGNVVNMLEDQGVFRNPLQMSLYDQFLPWLYQNVQQELVQQHNIETELENLCVELIEENKALHKQGYDIEMEKREQIREDKRQRQKELEEKRERKRLEKLRKIEMERRAKLRDEVAARILSKAEVKDNVLQNHISDIDNNQQEGRPFVGLVGGLVGEFILFMASLAQSQDEDLASGARELINNQEAIINSFKELLTSVLSEGSIDLPINNQIDALLAQKGEDLSLATLATAQLGDAQDEVIELIANNISSQILNAIREHANEFGFPQETIDQLIYLIVQSYFTEESLQAKIKFSPVKPLKGFSQAGIAYLRPDLESLTINTRSPKFGQEPEIGEDEEPIKVVPENLVESEFSNKVSLLNPKDEDLEVLVQHAVAEQVVREDILRVIAGSIKGVDGHEYPILYEALSKTQEYQRKVLDSIHNDFPVLDMKSY
ncbi:hypothetical protein ABPG74_001021 [Tetrahymena malaccensis]